MACILPSPPPTSEHFLGGLRRPMLGFATAQDGRHASWNLRSSRPKLWLVRSPGAQTLTSQNVVMDARGPCQPHHVECFSFRHGAGPSLQDAYLGAGISLCVMCSRAVEHWTPYACLVEHILGMQSSIVGHTRQNKSLLM